jgi:predicted RecA/RadA family phage recombinase
MIKKTARAIEKRNTGDKAMKKFLIGLMVAVIAVTVFGADNFVQSAGNLLWTNPGADVSSGELVDIGERYAVALVDIASNATGTVKTDGVFEFLRSETNAITIGDPIYFHDANTIKAAGAANVYVGAAAETVSAISTATLAAATAKIKVDLNATAEQDIFTYKAGAALGATALQPNAVNATNVIVSGDAKTNTIIVLKGLITSWVITE